MKLSDLFKSRQTREIERYKKEADAARAIDAGKLAGTMSMRIFDEFIEGRASDFALSLINTFKARIKHTHTTDLQDIVSEFTLFMDQLANYRESMIEEGENALGELKYVLIEIGSRDAVRFYLADKLDRMIEQMKEMAKTEGLYANARLQGMITAEEYAMPPDEFARVLEAREKAKADQAR